MRHHIVTAIIALVAGFAGAAAWSLSGMGDARMRTVMIENPDVLPLMAQELQRREGQDRLATVSDAVTTPFPGAVLGNPEGTRTLVEFSDYNCGYCRMSTEHVQQLIAADPQLRVVIREWPIFDGSDVASRMGLAAAKQGKFAAFHEKMFTFDQATPENVKRAAKQAGLDLEQAADFVNSAEADREIARNQALAEQLGFSGTPSWVAGDEILQGAVGPERLSEALESAAS